MVGQTVGQQAIVHLGGGRAAVPVPLVVHSRENEHVEHQEGAADGDGDAEGGGVGGQALLVGLLGVLLDDVGRAVVVAVGGHGLLVGSGVSSAVKIEDF